DDEDLMIITSSGTLIRTSMDGISTMGRYTQGVKLINIREEDDAVATVSRIDKNEEEPDEQELEGLEGTDADSEATAPVEDSNADTENDSSDTEA
ncbi:TPA: DNA gyrase C-terminal beta-propeller domain-containing protein, partial [Clostridioides difficile]